jgi:polygalacturonase
MNSLKAWGTIGIMVCVTVAARAQDTRTVTEPVFPPVCASVAASKSWTGDLPVADEDKPDTAFIQNAIDACRPGGAVELKAASGRNALLAGPLQLRPGVTLLIDQGVVLVASRNPRDYDLKAPGTCGTLAKSFVACKPLIGAVKADGSGVMGGGIIEGRGGRKMLNREISWWELSEQARQQHNEQSIPRLIQTYGTNRFTLYGITLRNAPMFHVVFNHGDGFTAWGVKIDSPLTARNTDGIDPGGATNVTITHSWFRTGDDDIAIKAPQGHPSSHLSITHNHFLGGHGVTIGSETQGGVSAIRVNDLTVEDNLYALTLRSNPLHGGEVKDVTYEDVCIRKTRYPVWFSTLYTDSSTSADMFAGAKNYGHFTDITLRNVRAATGTDLLMIGIAPQLPMEVNFDGVDFAAVEHMKQRVAHVRVTMGPGPVNWRPVGEDVQIAGKAGKGKLPSCDARWVKWPEE